MVAKSQHVLARARAPVWPAIAIGVLSVLATAIVARWLGAAPPTGIVAAGTFCAAVSVILMLRARGNHAGPFGVANTVTLTRVGICCGLFGLAATGGSPSVSAGLAWAVVGFGGIALALDGVDGWVARRRGECDAFGARFDMETNAATILLLAVLVWRWDLAPFWTIAIGGMRYGFVFAACAKPALRAPLPPSRRRQFICVAQMIALLVVLAPFTPSDARALIVAAALLILTASFTVDVRWLLSRARQ